MSEIIRELFRGNMQVLERAYDPQSRESVSFDRAEELAEELEARIPAEYHDLLEEYKTAVLELMDAACEEEYLAGYRLGVRLMAAAWQEQSTDRVV